MQKVTTKVMAVNQPMRRRDAEVRLNRGGGSHVVKKAEGGLQEAEGVHDAGKCKPPPASRSHDALGQQDDDEQTTNMVTAVKDHGAVLGAHVILDDARGHGAEESRMT